MAEPFFIDSQEIILAASIGQNRSFIRNLGASEKDAVLVKAMIAMAHCHDPGCETAGSSPAVSYPRAAAPMVN